MSYGRRNGAGIGAFLLIVLAVIAIALVAAVFGYVWFRIMAPELGWDVPSFKAIFWSTMLVSIPVGILSGGLKSD